MAILRKYQTGVTDLTYSNKPMEEVTVKGEKAAWAKLQEQYEKETPYEQFFHNEKQKYIKGRPKGLTAAMGVGADDLPENVVNSIYNDYQYNKNNYVTKNLGAQKGFNPKKHDEWVENLSGKEKEIVANSKYGENLQPSYWAKSIAGAQELGNAAIKSTGIPAIFGNPDKDVFNFKPKGLTNREWQEIHNSKIGALETASALDIPGVVVANYLKNSNRAQPNIFSGKPMANVSAGDAAGLNPFLLSGIGEMMAGKSLLGVGANALRPGVKAIGKKSNELYTIATTTQDRLKTLREAEDYMKWWTSHPATQEKILNSYKESLKLPNYHSVFGKVADSPIAKHNLEEVIKFTSGYNPTGRLKEYPIINQLSEYPNIHSNNTGVNYTHGDTPGEILDIPENTYTPKNKSASKAVSTEKPEADLNPNALDTNPAFPRHGSWISRKLNSVKRLSTGIHELTHDWVKAKTLKLTDQEQIIKDAIDYDFLKKAKEKHKDPEVDKLIDYLSDPAEVHARLMEIRKHFNLSPDDAITADQAHEILKEVSRGNTPINKEFAKIIKKDNGHSAAKLLNKAWVVAPTALGIGAIQQRKRGGILYKNY